MNEIKILPNIEDSNKKINENLYTKIEIRKILANKFKQNLINNNNAKILKHSKENKLSQTLIKKYNYDANNIKKFSNLTDALDLLLSHKYILSKPFKYPNITNRIQNKQNENKIHKTLKRIESSKICINKNILQKKIIKNKKKSNESLKNIDTNFLNSLKKNKMDNSIHQENKNVKDKLNDNNNNATPEVKIISKSQSMSKILNKINKDNKESHQLNKKLILRSNLFNKKHPKHIVIRNDILHSEKKGESINKWKNKIISDLLRNIQSMNNINLYKDKKIDKSHNKSQKVRISTLVNIYDKSFLNSQDYEL